jgi:hypothetical protein
MAVASARSDRRRRRTTATKAVIENPFGLPLMRTGRGTAAAGSTATEERLFCLDPSRIDAVGFVPSSLPRKVPIVAGRPHGPSARLLGR